MNIMANIKRLHPGIYIKDALDSLEMTAKEFSVRTGISERTLSSIMTGNGNITFDVAYKLSAYFDTSITYWTNLQNMYDLQLKEESKQQEIDTDWDLIKTIKSYLISYRYIEKTDDKETAVYKIRKLAGVNSLSLLNKKDSFVCLKEQHTQDVQHCFFQNFWIALALNEARKKKGTDYNKTKLKESILEIRAMTVQEPQYFYPRLQEIFDECGISFVLLPYLPKSNIYGATKWFSENNVMLAISNRGEKADLFWFTLFHEISHVLMEHRRETLINIKDVEDQEADQMAEEMLIPHTKWEDFVSKKIFTVNSIELFSKRMGILPCIVLGRLHKEGFLPYGRFDKHFNVSYQVTLE